MGTALALILLPGEWKWLLLVQPLVALGQGVSQPNITSIVSQLSPKETQGEILGIQQSVQSVAFAVPPLIAGVIVSVDVALPILAASFFVLLAWAVFYFGFTAAIPEASKNISALPETH
jgi:DHA1 family tetracycline resistance protein-like MFS transporter